MSTPLIIDPMEVLLNLLRADPNLELIVADRIASKHKFGRSGGWSKGDAAITLRPVPGAPPENYLAVQVLQFEVRCWGESPNEAMKVYRYLRALVHLTERETIGTDQGNGLLHYLNLISTPSLLYEEDIEADYVLVFVEASVAETAVT